MQEGIARANLQISRTLARIRQLDLQVAEVKTEVVIFRNRKHRISENHYVRIGREIIEAKHYMKYLGIFLDRDLAFREHANYIEEKALRVSQQLG